MPWNRGIRFSASAVALLLTAVAVAAADLPARVVPPSAAPVPIFSWTGFYVGAYGGGSFGGKVESNGPGGRITGKPSGLAAGGLAGYNLQFARAVIGIEGDAGYTDEGDTVNGRAPAGNGLFKAGDPRRFKDQADFVGRVRGRVGYAIGNYGFGEMMLFAAGGGSFLSDKQTLTDNTTKRTVGASKTRTGFNIGGGLEVAVTPSILARAEYIYDDYGKDTYGLTPQGGGAGGTVLQNRSVKINDSTVRAALEYKF